MILNIFFNSIIFFVILIIESINQTTNNTHVSANTLVSSRVNCSYPCLSICSADAFDKYNNSEELQAIYEAEIRTYNSTATIKDLSKYFEGNVAQPCNASLRYPLLTSPNDDWSIFEDGILFVHYDKSFRNQQQYCFDLKDIWQGEEYEGTLFVPYICSLINNNYGWDQWKNWAMVFSLPFFLSTILFYGFLPELKNCHGKCFIMYLTNLTLAYALISYANLSTEEFGKFECLTLGYAIYFTTIAFLTWISIISYDTYIALTGFSYFAIFRVYFIVGLMVPLITTCLVLSVQNLPIEKGFKPGIELGSCAVQTKRWSAMLYYYIPHIIVLVFCLFKFIKLIIFLHRHEKNAAKYVGKMKTSYKKRFTIYFRLFIFMGVIWFFEILSYITYMSLASDNFFTIILDYFNALHGLFIFLCITCSSNFWRSTMERFTRKRFAEHELITTTSLACSLDD